MFPLGGRAAGPVAPQELLDVGAGTYVSPLGSLGKGPTWPLSAPQPAP